MVRLKGFEPPTFWFVAKHSIQLSYWRIQEIFPSAMFSLTVLYLITVCTQKSRVFSLRRKFYFISSSISPMRLSNSAVASSTGFVLAMSTPAPRSSVIGSAEQPPDRKPR